METSTARYEFTHGKLPRGRGTWGFEFKINGFWTEPVFVYPAAPHFRPLTYSEARTIAAKRALLVGATMMRVCE